MQLYNSQNRDLLRVNLRSNVDNSLLFSAPIHASIVAARPSRHRSGDEVGEGGEGAGGGRLQLPNQWEGQKTSSTHVAVEGLHHISSRFWPNPEVNSGTHEVDEDDSHTGGGGGNSRNDQLDNISEASAAATSQWKRVEGRGWNHLSEHFETQQKPSPYDPKLVELFGSPALKDAPGMRSTSSYQRLSYPDSVDKALAKKATEERDVFVDRPNADSGLNEAAIKLSGGSEGGEKGGIDPIGGESGHRPALELIMYILLGLFILIALIFAVNCGAMVARYRWEHARGAKENLRLQHLSELAMSNANTDAAGMGECSSSSTADLQSQADQTDTIQDRLSGERETVSHYGCITAFATLRRKFGLVVMKRVNLEVTYLSADSEAEGLVATTVVAPLPQALIIAQFALCLWEMICFNLKMARGLQSLEMKWTLDVVNTVLRPGPSLRKETHVVICTLTAFQSLSQQRMNRDTDWIWLGRDALAGSQHDHDNNKSDSNNNLSGPRLTTATTSLELSKYPSLLRPPVNPNIPLPTNASVCDSSNNNSTNSRIVATPTTQQKLSLTSSYHAGSPRAPTTQKTSVSACATCHYEGEECSIRILTNTVEPEKSKVSASRRGVPSAVTAGQHLQSNSAGPRQSSQLNQSQHHHHHHRGHHQGERKSHHPHIDQRRRSAFTFGQSLILDHQNPDCQLSADCSFGHNHLQTQRCYCSRGFVSPWRYREPPQSSEPSRPEGDDESGTMPAILSLEGYRTLPSHIPAWQDGSDYGTPPCPPVRTSSKLKQPPLPPLLISYYGEQNNPSETPRPTSFPNESMAQQAPLLATSVTNEVYSLLAGNGGGDAVDETDEATLTRQPSARSCNRVQTTATANTELPRRTRSYTRIDIGDQTTATTMTPGSRRSSTRGPLETQSVSAGGYCQRTTYANRGPTPLTPTGIRSTISESVS
ncbi:unnamed protein product [Hydatigera taeniaeformis]|uniref:TMEM132D_C domain-containing protein n=1 Tax=Hydatigena taeniaeformis TaxID=6205 RepID=A0A0R3X901_HYDTA|nr:unnamed protein product [Hydatigera taeniaeformis]